MLKHVALVIITVCWFFNNTAPLDAQGFGCLPGDTLSKELASAQMVVYGTFKNLPVTKDAYGKEEGQSIVTIEGCIKNHPLLKDVKTVQLKFPISFEDRSATRVVLFGDASEGKADYFLALPCTPELLEYLKALHQIAPTDVAKRLGFVVDYLCHANADLSRDAYLELYRVEYADLKRMVKEYGKPELRQKLIRGLSDATVPDHTRNLIGLLIGLLGNKDDVPLIQNVLNQTIKKEELIHCDRLLLGYILLDKEAGWKYALTLTDPAQPFTRRYHVLRAVRHLWEVEPGIISRDELLKVLEKYVSQQEMSDLAIEDLRHWKQWRYTKRIIDLTTQKDFDTRIIRRAINRYMLSVPNDPQAKEYIARLRQSDPQQVTDAEEILELEKEGSKVKK